MLLRTLLLSAALAASASAAPANARGLGPAVYPNMVMPVQARGERRGDIRSLREVVEEIRSQYGGELISARLEEGGRPIYVLRWRMPDGQVRDFRVSASR